MIRPAQHRLLPSSASPRLSVSLCRNEFALVDASQRESLLRALQQHVHCLCLQLDCQYQGCRAHAFWALCVPQKSAAWLLGWVGWLLCWAGRPLVTRLARESQKGLLAQIRPETPLP